MKKLYVATMNDALFIIDQPPRPSHDDMADVPEANVIAKMSGNDEAALSVARRMVNAYNDAEQRRCDLTHSSI